MSRHQFRGGVSGTLAELEIDISRLWANGTADYSYLSWPMEIHLLPQKSPHTGYAFRTAGAQLYLLPGQKIADARPVTVHRVIQGHQDYYGSEHPVFEFPLDPRQLAALEKYRQGGPMKLRLHVELTVEEHGALQGDPDLKRPVLWGLKNLHCLTVQENIEISQGDWIEHILNKTGCGQIHVIELPALPIQNCAGLQSSFEALQQALKLERQGFYREAVAKCRVALEPFFDYVDKEDPSGEKRRIPKLKASWQTRLGQVTYDWLDAALNIAKGPANQAAHHSATIFDQLEAQMLLTITTALAAYAVKTQPEKKH